jgi:hypothetical protein
VAHPRLAVDQLVDAFRRQALAGRADSDLTLLTEYGWGGSTSAEEGLPAA